MNNLHLCQLNGFYRIPEQQAFGDIEFRIASNEQLDEWAAEGVVLYNKLFPPRPKYANLTKAVMLIIVVYTAGAAISALAAGGAGSVVAGTAAGNIAGTATAAGAASVTATSVTTTIMNVAKVVNAVGQVASAFGANVPDSLMKASSLMSGDIQGNLYNAAMEKGVDYLLEQQNMKIDKKNKRAVGALRERINRERMEQAALLKALADEQAALRNLPPPSQDPKYSEPPVKASGREWIALATPFILYFMAGG